LFESTEISTILAHEGESPTRLPHCPEETATQPYASTAERRYTPANAAQGVYTDTAQGISQTTSTETSPQSGSIQHTADDKACGLPVSQYPVPLCVIFGVKHASGMIDIENITISNDMNDPKFFAELKRLEAKYRWPVLKWLSPFIFSYCKFVQVRIAYKRSKTSANVTYPLYSLKS
jgi:hypothetical protein